MKKIALALLLLPAMSFADNVNFVGVEYGIGSDSVDTVGGIGYESVIVDKLSVGINYTDIHYDDGSKYDFVEVNVDYAFGSFSTGSLYTGLGTVMPYNEEGDILDGVIQSSPSVHDDLSTAVSAGFSKRSGEGLDYDMAVVFVDNYKLYTASLRAALGKSGLGLTYAVKKADGGIALVSLGLNLTF